MTLLNKTLSYELFWLPHCTYTLSPTDKIVYSEFLKFENADFKIIQRFSNKLNWNKLSYDFIGWHEKLIDEILNTDIVSPKTLFLGLCRNNYFIWNERLVLKYEKHINWEVLSGNTKFKPSIEFLKHFKHVWDWGTIFKKDKTYIKWDIDLLREFKTEIIPYLRTSGIVEWNIQIMKEFCKELFLYNETPQSVHPIPHDISYNKHLKWDSEMIETFIDLINWEIVSKNPKFPFTEKILEQFSHKVNFQEISNNIAIKWDEVILDKWFNDWNWTVLCRNPSIPWNDTIIKKYSKKINWKSISQLEKCWTYDFLEHYKEHLDWQELSKNRSILWTSKIIDAFSDKIDFWAMSLYGNISIEIFLAYPSEFEATGVLTRKYERYSDFGHDLCEEVSSCLDNLCMNINILWNDYNIHYFMEKINWYYLATRGNFSFSQDFIQSLPEIGIMWMPTHSMSSRSDEYIEQNIKEFWNTRNLNLLKQRIPKYS